MISTPNPKKPAAQDTPEPLDVGPYYTPLVDITETPDAFVFEVDLPGVKAQDIDINAKDGVITLEAKVLPRQKTEQEYLVREYGIGNYRRAFNISMPINADAINAEMKNGQLRLVIPKAESAKVHKVEVKSQ